MCGLTTMEIQKVVIIVNAKILIRKLTNHARLWYSAPMANILPGQTAQSIIKHTKLISNISFLQYNFFIKALKCVAPAIGS